MCHLYFSFKYLSLIKGHWQKSFSEIMLATPLSVPSSLSLPTVENKSNIIDENLLNKPSLSSTTTPASSHANVLLPMNTNSLAQHTLPLPMHPVQTVPLQQQSQEQQSQAAYLRMLPSMTIAQLKAQLKQRGLKVSGNKKDLIARLGYPADQADKLYKAPASKKRSLGPSTQKPAKKKAKTTVDTSGLFEMPKPIHANPSSSKERFMLKIPAYDPASSTDQSTDWKYVNEALPKASILSQFSVVYRCSKSQEGYFDHIFMLRPRQEVVLSLYKHPELFAYPQGHFEVRPVCDVCHVHAECFNESEHPIIKHIEKGLYRYGEQESAPWGEFNTENLRISKVCKNGHLTMVCVCIFYILTSHCVPS